MNPWTWSFLPWDTSPGRFAAATFSCCLFVLARMKKIWGCYTVCHGSLTTCTVKHRPIRFAESEQKVQLCTLHNLSCYFSQQSHHPYIQVTVLLAAIHNHAITLCLTDDMVRSSLPIMLVQVNHSFISPKNLVSELGRLFFCLIWLFCSWLLPEACILR